MVDEDLETPYCPSCVSVCARNVCECFFLKDQFGSGKCSCGQPLCPSCWGKGSFFCTECEAKEEERVEEELEEELEEAKERVVKAEERVEKAEEEFEEAEEDHELQEAKHELEEAREELQEAKQELQEARFKEWLQTQPGNIL